MMTTMAALLGALPLALGHGVGSRAAPAPGHRHRRRADHQPDPDPLHDAGHLSGLRPAGAAHARSATPEPATKHGIEHLEPLGIFIHRPVATTLLTIGLVLAGVIAFRLLPVSPLPQVDFPTISVGASLPGADPETMSTSVAAPLERQFGRIAGVTEMTSTSYRGSTSITLQFDLNRDIDGAARDVQAAINAARGYLPANLPSNPTYRKVNPSDAPILILALTSETMTKPQMYDAASTILQQKLSQVKGVGQVFVGGSSLPAVRVELNPMALSSYGISLEDVRGALRHQRQPPQGDAVMPATGTGRCTPTTSCARPTEYLPLVVSYRSGAAVRLTDVAKVQDSVEDVRTTGIVNGKPAVMVIIFRQPGANIIETVDSVRALLPQLKAALPGAIDLSVVLDRTPPIRGSLHDVEISLMLSGLLVILVVFWFLRNVRATIIPAVAVAVSIIGTFAVMYLCGYSLDNLSLMALTIATGFVVDDAIVVLENITRYREKGQSPCRRPCPGAAEIAFTVLLHERLAGGRVHPDPADGGHGRAAVPRVCRDALRGDPGLAGGLADPHPDDVRDAPEAGADRRARLPLQGKRARCSTGCTDTTRRRLRWALRHSRIMLLLMLVDRRGQRLSCSSSCPRGSSPSRTPAASSGTIQAAQDISFQAMSEKLGQIVDIIKQDPDVEYVIGFTGGGGGGSTTNTGRMFISLKPFASARPAPTRSSAGCAARSPRCRARPPSCSRCRTCASAAGSATPSTSTRCRGTTWPSSTTGVPEAAAEAAHRAAAGGREQRPAGQGARGDPGDRPRRPPRVWGSPRS